MKYRVNQNRSAKEKKILYLKENKMVPFLFTGICTKLDPLFAYIYFKFKNTLVVHRY